MFSLIVDMQKQKQNIKDVGPWQHLKYLNMRAWVPHFHMTLGLQSPEGINRLGVYSIKIW